MVKKLSLITTLFIANLLINTAAVAGNTSFLPTWSSAEQVQLQANKKTKRVHRGNRAKFDKGSGETTKERDSRLMRECKGRPNAGACLGYAS